VVGFIGFAYLTSAQAAFHMMASAVHTLFFNYNWAVIPLFILMGLILSSAGVGERIYRAAYAWLGHFPGGLALANIVGCALFGAICASASATAATMGAVSMPEMKKYKYDLGMSAGCIAAASTLGIMVPPSVTFIIYGILAEESIAKLFIAGVIPGILTAIMLYLVIYTRVRHNPHLAPLVAIPSWKERLSSVWGIVDPMIIFILIFGGMFCGFFTPTEAAAVGAFGALALCLIRRRLNWQKFSVALGRTISTSSFIYVMVAGALIFGYFLARTNVSLFIANWVSGLDVPRMAILALILIVYLIGGFVIEALPLIMLTVPLFLPAIKALGFDPIWFGVIIVLLAQIALLTPPVGVVTLIVAGMAREDVPMLTVFRAVMPFLAAMIVMLLLTISFPQLALFLPGLM